MGALTAKRSNYEITTHLELEEEREDASGADGQRLERIHDGREHHEAALDDGGPERADELEGEEEDRGREDEEEDGLGGGYDCGDELEDAEDDGGSEGDEAGCDEDGCEGEEGGEEGEEGCEEGENYHGGFAARRFVVGSSVGVVVREGRGPEGSW